MCGWCCSGDRVQISGVDGVAAGSTIQFQSTESCHEWMKAIQRNIATQNALSVRYRFTAELRPCYELCYYYYYYYYYY